MPSKAKARESNNYKNKRQIHRNIKFSCNDIIVFYVSFIHKKEVEMLILGSDISNLRLFHLHRNWTSKIRWNRDWRKTRTNAKWSIANVDRFVHPRVYRSPIFLLHGVTKSKKEDEVLNHEN